MRLDVLLFFIVFTFNGLPHPPYSPDLAPSDFHLFRYLQWFLRDITLETEEEVKSALDDFFASKDISFYQRGIHCLVQKWKDVIQKRQVFNYVNIYDFSTLFSSFTVGSRGCILS